MDDDNLEQPSSGKVKKSKKIVGVKNLVKSLEREELIEVILELSKISKKNEQFIKIFVQGSNKENIEQLVKDVKSKLEFVFFRRNGLPQDHINLKAAREIVNEHSRILKGFPEAILEIKLYFVELGVDITSFAEMNSSFYNSMASMLRDFCNDLFKYHQLYSNFSERLNNIISNTEHIGWGFHEFVLDTIWDLEDRLGVDDDDEVHDDENDQIIEKDGNDNKMSELMNQDDAVKKNTNVDNEENKNKKNKGANIFYINENLAPSKNPDQSELFSE